MCCCHQQHAQIVQCCLSGLDGAALKQLFQQNAELKEEIRVVKSLLHEVLRRQKGNETTRSTGKLPDNVKLPVATLKEVRSLEEKLRSNDIYSQLVCIYLFAILKTNV